MAARSVSERFWEKVDKRGPVHPVLGTRCWLWTASSKRDGYGQIWIGPKSAGFMELAHRISWELHNGPIPEGKWVLHHCDNPPCTNPAHLYLGTRLDNMHDMVARGRQAVWTPKTHCLLGHPYDVENTVLEGARRKCLTCRRTNAARRRQRNRARINERQNARSRQRRIEAGTFGRPPKNRNREKTRCKRGHEFNEANTLRYKGCRYCRACNRERKAAAFKHGRPPLAA